MIRTEKYNKFSSDYLKRFRLLPGETAIFRYTKLTPDPNPANPEGLFRPKSVHVEPEVLVWDSVLEESILMGAIDRETLDGKVKFQTIAFRKENMNMIVLNGNSIKDQHLYTYLMLHPKRKGSPNADANIPPEYELHVEEDKARERRRSIDKLRIALVTAGELRIGKAKQIVAAMGYDPSNMSRDEVMAICDQKANTDPDGFLEMVDSKDTPYKSIIKLALTPKNKVLRYVSRSRKIEWVATGNPVVAVPPGEKPEDTLYKLIISSDAGEALFKTLESSLELDKVEEEKLEPVAEEKLEPKTTKGGKKSMTTIRIKA